MTTLLVKEKSNKRSSIHPKRLAELMNDDVVYVVTCDGDEFLCPHEEGCWRGFFSLYIQAAYGIYFAKQVNVKWYVDYGNVLYRYSDLDKFEGENNFWNYYFQQSGLSVEDRRVPNISFESYPLRLWDSDFISEINSVAISQLQLKPEVEQYISDKSSHFDLQDILGIHIRKTDHFVEVKPVKFSTYVRLIDKYIDAHDKLFIATDDQKSIDLLNDRYPGKIIFNTSIRSKDESSLHGNMEITDRYKLGLDALLDCYCLSKCKKAILVSSNLSYAALLLNPNLSYVLAESTQAWVQRWKTMLVFYLNKWNIRKW